jgi:hypothetical protein
MDEIEASKLQTAVYDMQKALSTHVVANNMKFAELESAIKTKEDNMSDASGMEGLGPMLMSMATKGSGGGDGMFGGNGLIGGLILGSLLRNNGNLLGGGDGAAGALGATLRNPPEQNQANMDLMASIGQVDKAVAVSTATMEASQAAQTASIVAQLNSQTGSLATRIDGTKETVNAMAMVLAQQLNGVQQQVMTNRYELSKDISTDGEKTRALITSQYELNLQRQLADANAAIIELRNREHSHSAARGVEVNTTNLINQTQQQQQQQAQYGQLASLIYGLGQSIRDNNSAINVGSGTQTSTNTPTNTNIR